MKKPVTIADAVMGGGAIVTFLFSFFPFFSSGGWKPSAWDPDAGAFTTTLPALLALGMAVWIGLELGGVALPQQVLTFDPAQIKAVLGSTAALIMIAWLSADASKGFGFWLMLLGSAAMATGSVMALLGKWADAVGGAAAAGAAPSIASVQQPVAPGQAPTEAPPPSPSLEPQVTAAPPSVTGEEDPWFDAGTPEAATTAGLAASEAAPPAPMPSAPTQPPAQPLPAQAQPVPPSQPQPMYPQPPAVAGPPPETAATKSFWGAYKDALSRYAQFDGRLSIGGFWRFYLVNLLIGWGILLLSFVILAAGSTSGLGLFALYFLYLLAVFIPTLAACVRRLHDTDKAGVYLLFGLIPFAGPIIMIVFLVGAGDPNPNQYGPPAA